MVSVITPAYNASRYLNDTIRSVMAQSHEDWEMIVINDCSTDDTADIVRSLMKRDKRIRLIELPRNQGAAVARNKGIEIARGDFMAFIDSDDLWHSEKLRIQLRAMEQDRSLLSFTSYKMIAENGKVIKVFKAPPYVTYPDLLKGCNIGCSTVVYNARVIGKHFFSPFSPHAREDYVLWLRLAKNEIKAGLMIGIDEPLVSYRKHGDGISSGKSRAAWNQWKVYREMERLNLLSSMFYFAHYAINGLKKHYW